MRKYWMKNIQKRGDTFRVQIRKAGITPITRTFDTLEKAQEFRERILDVLAKTLIPVNY